MTGVVEGSSSFRKDLEGEREGALRAPSFYIIRRRPIVQVVSNAGSDRLWLRIPPGVVRVGRRDLAE